MLRVLAVAAVLMPLCALGHGEADWIRQGGYLDAEGNRCCGPEDCTRAPDDAIRRVPGGWATPSTGQLWPEGTSGLFRSPDLSPWWCVRDGIVRCIFVPPDFG